MMEKMRRFLHGLREKTAARLKGKGYLISLAACGAVLFAAVAAAFLPGGEEEPPSPAPSEAPVAYSNDERLSEALRTPAPTPAPIPTPMPDMTAPPPSPAAPVRTKAAPPVKGEIIWGYAVDSLLYSRTLDQWMTHPGVDVAAPKGTAVHAVFGGTVERIYRDDAFGVTVEILSGDGTAALYANLQEDPPLREGARVNAGDVVGKVGDTAVSECGEKSHLHFAMYADGKSVDPTDYILFEKALGA